MFNSTSKQSRLSNCQQENQRSLSALELIELPVEVRQRRVKAAIESAANEDFEIFEAYNEEAPPGDYSSP